MTKGFAKKLGYWTAAALSLCVVFTLSAHALTIPDLLQKIQENQGKIQSLQADMITTIESSNKKIPAMKQTAKFYQKYPDKSRMEMTQPMKQTTITNGAKMKMIDGATGKSFVQDLSKVQESSAMSHQPSGMRMDPTKALEKFDLAIIEESDTQLVLEGRPKDENKFLDKMRFTFSRETFLPIQVDVFAPGGKKLSSTTIQYEEISGVYVPVENRSSISLPQGEMRVAVVYENVKVNERIADTLFRVE